MDVLSKRFLMGATIVALAGGCKGIENNDIEVTSRSSISGTVNEQSVRGRIEATFDTGAGGTSTCTFEALPEGFNPATFGTHT